MKRKLIIALSVLTLCSVAFAYWWAKDKSVRLHAIGDYLVQQSIAGTVSSLGGSRDVPGLVWVDYSLVSTLDKMRPEFQNGYTVNVWRGVASTADNPRHVTHGISLFTANDDILLRMRYDYKLDRFHIVNFSKSLRPNKKEEPVP